MGYSDRYVFKFRYKTFVSVRTHYSTKNVFVYISDFQKDLLHAVNLWKKATIRCWYRVLSPTPRREMIQD